MHFSRCLATRTATREARAPERQQRSSTHRRHRHSRRCGSRRIRDPQPSFTQEVKKLNYCKSSDDCVAVGRQKEAGIGCRSDLCVSPRVSRRVLRIRERMLYHFIVYSERNLKRGLESLARSLTQSSLLARCRCIGIRGKKSSSSSSTGGGEQEQRSSDGRRAEGKRGRGERARTPMQTPGERSRVPANGSLNRRLSPSLLCSVLSIHTDRVTRTQGERERERVCVCVCACQLASSRSSLPSSWPP